MSGQQQPSTHQLSTAVVWLQVSLQLWLGSSKHTATVCSSSAFLSFCLPACLPACLCTQRRKEMKHQLGLPEDYGIPDSDGEQGEGVPARGIEQTLLLEQSDCSRLPVGQRTMDAYCLLCVLVLTCCTGGGIDEEAAAAAAAKAEVKQYQQAGFMTTVSITNFNAGYNDSSDDEGPADAAGSDDADDAAGDTAAAQHTARQQQQNPKKQHKKQQPGQQQRSKGSKSGGTKHGKVAKKKKHR
jgi:hypothetical protein